MLSPHGRVLLGPFIPQQRTSGDCIGISVWCPTADVRHAGYIGHWIELLRADKRAAFTACSQASKAADYLRGLARADRTEVARGNHPRTLVTDRVLARNDLRR
jgi:antirestriction protein ArdC